MGNLIQENKHHLLFSWYRYWCSWWFICLKAWYRNHLVVKINDVRKRGNKEAARCGIPLKLSYSWSVFQRSTIVLFLQLCLSLNNFCSQGSPGGGVEFGKALMGLKKDPDCLEASVYPEKKPEGFQPLSSSSCVNFLNSKNKGSCLTWSFM